jgi:mono/diheme cytochrome c family protein
VALSPNRWRGTYFTGDRLLLPVVPCAVIRHTLATSQTRHAGQYDAADRRGQKLWETHNCIGCHTLLGEGAYFAPELGNVIVRYGDEGVKAFIQSRPKEGIPGRRSMPQFNFTDEQLNAIVAFLKHVNSVNTNNWPPNSQG